MVVPLVVHRVGVGFIPTENEPLLVYNETTGTTSSGYYDGIKFRTATDPVPEDENIVLWAIMPTLKFIAPLA